MSFIGEVVILILAAILAVCGFFVRGFFKRIKKIEDNANNYATKEEMRQHEIDFQNFLKELMTPVNRKLESIEVHLRNRRVGD